MLEKWKYHYQSDCHHHNRGNLLFISGVLAILKFRSFGVPDKVAIIRNKVLVTCIFSFQSSSERLPILWFGINPFHLFELGERFWGGVFSKFLKYFFERKKAAYYKFKVNRRRVEIFIFMMYNM